MVEWKNHLKPGVGIRNRVPGIPQSRFWKSGTRTGTETHFEIRDWDRDSNSKFSETWTGTGAQIWKIWDPGPEQGRKIRKSGIRDRDSKLKNPGSRTRTGTQICGTRESGNQLLGTVPGTKEFRNSVLGTENFPGHWKFSGTRSDPCLKLL